MGKYIIELPDDENLISWWVYTGTEYGKQHIDFREVVKTPYTEPDLDAIHDEAYEKGVQDTKQHLVDAPRTCAYKLGYESGLNNAWDAARKIESLSAREFDKAFTGYDDCFKVFENYTPQEAIEKIKQYEQEQQIQVGDEVVFYNGEKCVVTVVEDGQTAEVMDKDGFSMMMDDGLRNSMKKTGRHFPEIAEVLKKMHEEKE